MESREGEAEWGENFWREGGREGTTGEEGRGGGSAEEQAGAPGQEDLPLSSSKPWLVKQLRVPKGTSTPQGEGGSAASAPAPQGTKAGGDPDLGGCMDLPGEP